jgi:ABC-type amino acid transport substrate-binding protein
MDMAVGDITVNSARVDRVDFTPPWIDTGLVVVARQAEVLSASWAFFAPFSPWVWTCLLLYLVLYGVVLWVLERREPPADRKLKRFENEVRARPRLGLYDAVSFALFTPWLPGMMEPRIRGVFTRIFTFWFLLGLLVILSTYQANLASFLVVPRVESSAGDIDSLLKEGKKIAVYDDGSTDSSGAKIRLRGAKEENLVPYLSSVEALQILTNDSWPVRADAIVDDRIYFQHFSKKYCGITTVGRVFDISEYGFAFHKTPRLKPAFDAISREIIAAKQSGLIERTRKRWLDVASDCPKPDAGAVRLTPYYFAPIFVAMFISGVAFLILDVSHQLYVAKLSKQKKR